MDEALLNAPHVRAQVALGSSPIYDLRELRVELDDEKIELHGSVESFYHKQLAQEAVRAVVGDVDLVNFIIVCETSLRAKPR